MSAPEDHDDDDAFERLHVLGYRLLVPVVPGIGIHPESPVYARRGKGPGVKGDDGAWYGLRGWQQHETTDEDLVRWSLMGAGTGIRTGRQPDGTWLAAIDADTLHQGHALTIAGEVMHSFGPLPMRIGNAPKALFPIRLSAPLPYMQVRFDDGTEGGGLVEILGENRHFVAAGIHPKTENGYTWPDALVAYDSLPIVAPSAIEAFLARLRGALPNAIGSRGAFASAKDQAALRGDPELVRRAVRAIPNAGERFRPRQAWIAMGCAIRAAVEDEFQAFDIFLEWSSGWAEGDNDPDEVASNWGRIRPPFQIGAGYLFDLADKLGGGNFRAEHHHEKVTEPEPAEAKTDDGFSFGLREGSNEPVISEDEAGIQFAEAYQGKFRFCTARGRWLVWDGAIWRENNTRLAFHRVREHIRRMAADRPEKVRIAAGKAAFAGAVERYAQADPAFAVTADAWDRDPWSIATPGGTVDLRTGELRPARPEDGMTKSTAVAPAASADCPLWRKFLGETFGGDAATIAFAQRWGGYCLTGLTREHALVFGHGDGGNGKGVYANTHVGILGDYAVTASMDTFIASHGDRHSTDLAMLRGARLVTASETEEGRQWAEARIKSLTGGDRITARFMRQDFFTFTPTFKLLIFGNHKPGLRNVDAAARRRFNLVPFTNKPAAKDDELDEKLKSEWPAILRWLIDGCLMWQRDGLAPPASVREATATYFTEQDILGEWMAERCIVDRGNELRQATTTELFASWSAHAKAANEPAGTERSFSQRLEKAGFDRKEKVPGFGGGRSRGFTGIAVRRADDQREAA